MRFIERLGQIFDMGFRPQSVNTLDYHKGLAAIPGNTQLALHNLFQQRESPVATLEDQSYVLLGQEYTVNLLQWGDEGRGGWQNRDKILSTKNTDVVLVAYAKQSRFGRMSLYEAGRIWTEPVLDEEGTMVGFRIELGEYDYRIGVMDPLGGRIVHEGVVYVLDRYLQEIRDKDTTEREAEIDRSSYTSISSLTEWVLGGKNRKSEISLTNSAGRGDIRLHASIASEGIVVYPLVVEGQNCDLLLKVDLKMLPVKYNRDGGRKS